MSAAQQRQRSRGPTATQSSAQAQRHGEPRASQVASSQVDFQQAPHERQETRQGYRNLQAETYDSREQLIQPTAEARKALTQVFRDADELFGNVKMPREGVLDSKLINYASKLVVEQVDRLNSGFRSYDPKAFAAEIRKMLGTENGTLALTRRARHFSLGTNTATFMLGALDVPIKEPKERQRRAKDVIQEETTAQDVDDLEADNKNEATKRVEELNAHLPEENSDMNFWEYVYDGDEEKGFGRTIENIFYSSFLVRDGHAGIDVSERHPSVSAKVAPLAQDYVDRRATKHQCVVQFDYKTWLKLRDSFGDRTYLPPPIAEYVSEAAASTKKKPGSAKKDSQANGNKKVVKKSAASSSQASVTSPNAKKRGRLSLESQESENGEMDGSEENGVSQIEDTPAERLPTAKRRAV